MKVLLINSTTTSHKIYLENWDPSLSIDLRKNDRAGLFYDLYDNTPLEIIPSSQIPDNVSNVKSSEMYKSITGWPGGNPYWQPEAWSEFRDNVRYFYPFQLNQILGLSLAYF